MSKEPEVKEGKKKTIHDNIFIKYCFSIRTTNICLLFILFILIYIILLIVFLIFFIITFDSLELLDLNNNSKKINRVIGDIGKTYSIFLLQFTAAFNDTYNFLQNPTYWPGYVATQWPSNAFRNFGIFFVAYYDLNNNLIPGSTRTFNLATGNFNEIPFPPQFSQKNPIILNYVDQTVRGFGLYYYPTINSTMFIISAPILRTDLSGPGVGSIVIGVPTSSYAQAKGTSIDQSIADRSQQCITFFNTNNQNATLSNFINFNDFFNYAIKIGTDASWQFTNIYTRANLKLNEDPNLLTPNRTQGPSNSTIEQKAAGVNVYNDIYGFDQSRKYFIPAVATILSTLGAFFIIFIIMFISVLILFECLVLTRLINLTKKVNYLDNPKNLKNGKSKLLNNQKKESKNMSTSGIVEEI